MKPDPRQHIFERDNFTCQYCGAGGREDFDKWFVASLSIDHIKPRIHGGSNDDSNLIVACHACNVYKGSIDCNTKEEAKKIVEMKRAQARKWFEKYVAKKII